MKTTDAEIIREFGPFPGANMVAGVSYDGQVIWWASGQKLNAMDPETGETLRYLEVPATVGTAFDGTHLYQIAEGKIQKLDPQTGEVLSSIPTPSQEDDNSGMAWAEGSLWVGQMEGKKILQIDPETGEILRTIHSERMVTGVTWVDGDLWHGFWEEDDSSGLNHIDSETGEVFQRLDLPPNTGISGLESDGKDRFYCGGGSKAMLRVVKRPG